MERKIYLKQQEIWVGVGATRKTTRIEDYYQAIEVDGNQVEMQLLDIYDQPIGKTFMIEKDKLKDYLFCPDYFRNKKDAKERTTEKHVPLGDKHFKRREFLSADQE